MKEAMLFLSCLTMEQNHEAQNQGFLLAEQHQPQALQIQHGQAGMAPLQAGAAPVAHSPRGTPGSSSG